jgi:hypothetical protein
MKKEWIEDSFGFTVNRSPGKKGGIHGEKGPDLARHLAGRHISFGFGQGTTDQKPEVNKAVIKQTSTASPRDVHPVL